MCPRCLATITPARERTLAEFDGVRVRANYEGAISAAIHAFKYDRQTRLAEPLGRLLCEALEGTGWPIDLVTAVPLHARRLRERGYNQAGLLGEHAACTNGWEFVPAAVARVRETASQVALNASERRANVAGAFEADPEIVAGKHILLVDDVLTTGATLSACAAALRMAGAAQVYGAAIATPAFDTG